MIKTKKSTKKKASSRQWILVVICTSLLAIFFGIGGCAGPSRKAAEPRTFEQWAREDRGRHLSRNIDPAVDMRAYPATYTDAPALPEGARLDDYVQYAMKNNPELEAAFYQWRTALEQVPQVRTLPDPMASFSIVLDQVEREAEYMGERYTLSQTFPWFGKLSLEGEMAVAMADAAAQRLEAVRLQLVDRVSRAHAEYVYAHRAVRIARENSALLVRLESVTREMFRGGLANLSEVSRAQMEIGRLDDQVRSLEDLLEVAAAELNSALGRPAHASLPVVTDTPSTPSPQTMMTALPELSDQQWLSLARQHNPELAAARHQTQQQRQAVARARRNSYPDITVGVEYARDGSARVAMIDGGGADMLAVMFSVNLPIRRGKYDAGVREMQARHDAVNRDLQGQANRLEADLKVALYTYRDSLRKMALYGDTLRPLAQQTLATTEAAYRTGNAGFSDLIDAQRVLLEFSLAHERAAADHAGAITRIQALVGRTRNDPIGEPNP
jgi:outer membrane protein, heavy metal efflux system